VEEITFNVNSWLTSAGGELDSVDFSSFGVGISFGKEIDQQKG